MQNPNLYFTSIEQVFGIEFLKEIESENQRSEIDFPEDWGNDRIVSLREKDTPVKRQWNGTCTSFAVIAAMENKLGGNIELSERSLWDFYGKFSTQTAINTARNSYILEEIYWPQGQSTINDDIEKQGRYRISKIKYLGRDYLSVLNAINNGNPCVVALKTPKDLAKGFEQVESTSRISRRGGHAMCVSGYKVENGKCYFLNKNSWGLNNGDNGYQYIDFTLYKSQRKRYCYFWEIVEVEERVIDKKNSLFNDEVRLEGFWEFE